MEKLRMQWQLELNSQSKAKIIKTAKPFFLLLFKQPYFILQYEPLQEKEVYVRVRFDEQEGYIFEMFWNREQVTRFNYYKKK